MAAVSCIHAQEQLMLAPSHYRFTLPDLIQTVSMLFPLVSTGFGTQWLLPECCFRQLTVLCRKLLSDCHERRTRH